MHNRPIDHNQNKDKHRTKHQPTHKHLNQYGRNVKHDAPRLSGESLLFEIPPESLTHITAFLDPPSLFAFGRTNKRLHQHVADDNTWRRAYVYQFLGILPEDDIQYGNGQPVNGSGRHMMLRRTESSWKREFIFRWNLKRRWERSRPMAVTHVPTHSSITSIHLISIANVIGPQSYAVLSSSLQYGIVSRSFPFTGRILRGYLDAAGTLNGLGIGNPNAEFSPDLTKCAMASDGGTAKVLWGFRNGTVAITNAPKAMEGARPVSARWARCQLSDAHDGAVEDAIWTGLGSMHAVTAGADGRVKIWDAKRMACIWTSELKHGQILKDPCVKVASDINQGIVVGLMKSGELAIWSGFAGLLSSETDRLDVREIRVAPHSGTTTPPNTDRQAKALYLHASSPRHVSVLVAYENECVFFRASVNIDERSVEWSTFGGDATGHITALQPVLATNGDEKSFVIVGDHLGCVSIYPWNTSSRTVTAMHTLEAHNDASVTALAWSPTILVAGSSKGMIKVFDSLNFASLRSFPCAVSRPAVGAAPESISNIIVQREVLVVTIGSRVMAWFVGPPGKEKANLKGKYTKSSRSHNLAKWQQQVEMYRDIAESRQELEYEQATTRRTFSREREQQTRLADLGLDEVEAVEYVLMLSREEEEARRRAEAASAPADEGVFFDDFDDLHTPLSTEEQHLEGPSRSVFYRAISRNSPDASPSRLLIQPLESNQKVYVSPRIRPEPTEAGPSISSSDALSLSQSYSSSSSASNRSESGSIPSADDPSEFPSMSSTPTHRSISVVGSVGSSRGATAWSTPLSIRSTPGPSSPASARNSVPYSSVASSPSGQRGQQGLSSGLANLRIGTPSSSRSELNEREAEELRFAIELSLAEARSRGEDV